MLHKLWEDFVKEAALLRAAPRSFGVLIILIGGILYFLLSQYYGAQLTGRDTQIGILRDTIGSYQAKLNGASPSQAADQIKALQRELEDANKKIEALRNPPRNENGIYQGSRLIGVAQGVSVDPEKKLAVIALITVVGDLDRASNVEYRNLILSFVKSDGYSQARMGLDVKTTYNNATFDIVGNRQD